MSDTLDTKDPDSGGRGTADPQARRRIDDLPSAPSGFNWRSFGYHSKGAVAVVVSLVVLVGGGWFALTQLQQGLSGVFTVEDYPGPGQEPEVNVEIPLGSSANEIGAILAENDVIQSTDAWSEAISGNPDAANVQAGDYTMLSKMSAEEALEHLLDPEVLQQESITVREALRLDEQYEEIIEQTDFTIEELREAGADGEAYGLSPWAEGDPEGFLFPDTYNVRTGAGPRPVFEAMAGQFDAVTSDIELERKAGELGYTPRELVTVASIIEAEVRRDEDRPKVARVLYNRLDRGMPLQLDTTVKYANGVRGNSQTTAEERAFESPYNTYLNEGLPPGPIAAPGRAGLEAAANPEDGNWIYFVAVNLETGETKFAEDDAGHQRNVQEYREWCWANQGTC